MPVAKLYDGSDWVTAIVGAKGEQGDPGIVIDEGSGFQDGDILIYDATADTWVPGSPPPVIPPFNSRTVITATNASWSVPTLANPIVRVQVMGGGGAGAGRNSAENTVGGADGGTSTFNAGTAGTVSAAGGLGVGNGNTAGRTGTAGFATSNGGGAASHGGRQAPMGGNGNGGSAVVAYFNLAGVSTVNVTIGAGGAAGSADSTPGGSGGRGEVIVEYAAG